VPFLGKSRPGPDDVVRLANLAGELFGRFEQTGAEADLDAAIAAVRRALELTRPGDPDRAPLMSNLGVAALSRFELACHPADLDTAVQVGREAVDLTAQDDPDLPGRLSNLGDALRIRAGYNGDPADLDAAVDAVRRAAALTLPGHPALPDYLSGLADVLIASFEFTGSGTDLDAAVDSARQAVALTPEGGAEDVWHLSSLAKVLRIRFEHRGDPADLDAAIDVGRRAVDLAPPGHPTLAWDLSYLGVALFDRFELTGGEADLNDAVGVGRRAVDLAPPGHLNRPAYLSNLGIALGARFTHCGDRADLDAAIDAGQQAVELTSPGHLSYADFQANLANVLRMRALVTGHAPDLDAAVSAGRQAVELTPAGRPGRPFCLSNLGSALLTRYGHSEDPADLDAAVQASREAAELFPPGHPRHAVGLSNLAGALMARFDRSADASDLDTAIDCFERAAATALPGDPRLALYLRNLAMAVRTRSGRAGDAGDLDTAIDHLERAVAIVPAAHPDLTGYLSDLADALFTRFKRAEDGRDLDAALGRWRQAAEIPTGIPGFRLAAAQNLAVTAADAGRTRASADGFAQAVALLPRVAWHGLDRAGREEQLAHWYGLAAGAAACALSDDRPGLAVELLEQGRSVQWAQALALRGDLARLAGQAPALAGRLDAVRAGLDAHPPADSPRVADRRMALAREWDDLLEQVHGLAGFEDFLRAPRLERLLPAADAGPVVIVNVSPWRCDALIVTAAGVQVKKLAGLTSEEVTARARGYLGGLYAVEQAAVTEQAADRIGRRPDAKAAASVSLVKDAAARSEENLRQVTGWLWDQVAGPVLAELGFAGPPPEGEPWPRLWWCPTGPLSLLPLHAAGHHTAEGRARHESVLDRVASSYTPTLRALLEARAARNGLPAGRMLAVGVADAPGQQPLPNVARELRLLAERFPGRHTTLDGPAATWEAVRAELPGHGWVHFSCHADTDLDDPSRGRVLLYDRPLSVADIAEGRYRGEFAFLSACKTAAGGSALPDEAITLAAALHYTGYRHVIGTLWSVHDRTAADVAAAVYADLTSAGTFEPARAAHALHRAVRRLRAAGKPLTRWTPFTHTGP
jgi:tetratricopeptide (TPR) repeat protein